MKRIGGAAFSLAATSVLAMCGMFTFGQGTATAADPESAQLFTVDAKAIAAREKALAETAPDGAKLVAYLDCGTQRESTTSEEVRITWAGGKCYEFKSEAEGVSPTQSTVFYDDAQVVFELSGVDRGRRYMAGLSWWDYDNGGRSQSVLVGSPDGRAVRLAVPAIRLPNYTDDGQLLAERRFLLPVTFARDGKMRLTVQGVTGANTVISELWIWQLD